MGAFSTAHTEISYLWGYLRWVINIYVRCGVYGGSNSWYTEYGTDSVWLALKIAKIHVEIITKYALWE